MGITLGILVHLMVLQLFLPPQVATQFIASGLRHCRELQLYLPCGVCVIWLTDKWTSVERSLAVGISLSFQSAATLPPNNNQMSPIRRAFNSDIYLAFMVSSGNDMATYGQMAQWTTFIAHSIDN